MQAVRKDLCAKNEMSAVQPGPSAPRLPELPLVAFFFILFLPVVGQTCSLLSLSEREDVALSQH